MSPNADTGVWDLLDFSTSQHILTFLHPQEALQASSTCKLFHDQCEQPSLWKHFYEQYISEVQSSVQVEETKTNTLPASNSETDWKTRVHKALAVKDVKFGRWEKIVQDKGTRRPKTEPCPREGHAGQSWGDNGSMILFGGWGCGIRNDTYILRPCNPHDSASSSSAGAPTTSATPPDGGAGSSCPGAQAAGTTTQEQGGDPKVDGKSPMKLFTQWVASTSREPAPCFEWTAPVTQGTLPSIRYGHTATRCGTKGEMLLIFGGMQRGGYSGEINSLAVLKPATADLPAGSDTAAASSGPSTLEWVHPNLEGPELTARGYHASCASPCGKKVFLFGGLGDHGCNNVLEVVDVTTWRCESPATSGTPPSARFGNSMVVYDKKLWVIGGGFGYDIARSGYDLADIHCLDLETNEWPQPRKHAQVNPGSPEYSGTLE